MQEIIESLDRYVHKGIAPGGFLMAVLRNDLVGATGRADHINRFRLFEIVSYCYNNIPESCWGSPEKVESWFSKKAQ